MAANKKDRVTRIVSGRFAVLERVDLKDRDTPPRQIRFRGTEGSTKSDRATAAKKID